MAISDGDLASVRDWVGDTPDDETVNETWTRTGTVVSCALAVLRRRRADLAANPTKWSSDQDYSEDWTGALKALDQTIARLEDLVDAEAPEASAGNVVTTGALVRCGPRR